MFPVIYLMYPPISKAVGTAQRPFYPNFNYLCDLQLESNLNTLHVLV